MSKIEDFVQEYVTSLHEFERNKMHAYEITDFGNTKELADSIGALVRSGIKTTTSMLLWELEKGDEKYPFVGEIDVVTDGKGEPLCIIEFTEIEVRPFNAIDEAFAYDYGEGDRTLAWWRAAMRDYYVGECHSLKREPSESMPLVCMRFRLLYPAVR
ncbi:MAG: ASCH domain-containing protein [Chloroflexota bacterium]|nr:ASCH domain-containing protein [Chloroflexota bacterium]